MKALIFDNVHIICLLENLASFLVKAKRTIAYLKFNPVILFGSSSDLSFWNGISEGFG